MSEDAPTLPASARPRGSFLTDLPAAADAPPPPASARPRGSFLAVLPDAEDAPPPPASARPRGSFLAAAFGGNRPPNPFMSSGESESCDDTSAESPADKSADEVPAAKAVDAPPSWRFNSPLLLPPLLSSRPRTAPDVRGMVGDKVGTDGTVERGGARGTGGTSVSFVAPAPSVRRLRIRWISDIELIAPDALVLPDALPSPLSSLPRRMPLDKLPAKPAPAVAVAPEGPPATADGTLISLLRARDVAWEEPAGMSPRRRPAPGCPACPLPAAPPPRDCPPAPLAPPAPRCPWLPVHVGSWDSPVLHSRRERCMALDACRATRSASS